MFVCTFTVRNLKGGIFMPEETTVLTLHLDSLPEGWEIEITDPNLENKTAQKAVLRRKDGKFFHIETTSSLGYLFPMIFENLNKNGIAGTICLLVRHHEGKNYIVVERKPWVENDNTKAYCVRALRSSVSSPEGSPIPKGSKGAHWLGTVQLNNMRITGKVQCVVIVQPIDTPLEEKQELWSFEEFAKTDDAPGLAVLCKYLLS